MSQNENKEQAKQNAMLKIASINAVEGFDPLPLAMEITDMNDGGVRYRLPVMAQMAWFRLKYPEGRISISVKPGKDYFVAEARVYVSYKDPVDCFLSEGSASRGFLPDKPSVSPREWAQTAAIGIALRNAGFGLQFAIAGESYEANTLNELASMNVKETPNDEAAKTTDESAADEEHAEKTPASSEPKSKRAPAPAPTPAQPELTPLEKAMATLCPIAKHKDKTLGDMIRIDPNALAYIAKSDAKYGAEIADSARLICEDALKKASA